MKKILMMGIILIILMMLGCVTDKSKRKTTEWPNGIITYGLGYNEAMGIYDEVSEYRDMRVIDGEIWLIRVDSIIPKHNGEPQYFIRTETTPGVPMVLINPHDRSDGDSDVFDESDMAIPMRDFRKLWYDHGTITIIDSQDIEVWQKQ